MPPQLLSSRRPRAIALVVTLMLAAGACSGGDDDTPKTGSTLGDSRNDSYKGSIDLKLGPTTVASSSDVSTLDRKVAKDVLAAVGDFVDAAVVEPLLSGKQAKNLERFFGLRVYTRVQTGGKDRAALSDENLPDIAADVEATADPVGLDALVGSDGTVLMIGAKLSLHVRTETADGPLTITRTGGLILEPAAGGRWQITGYDIEVTRKSAGRSTTTTASAESTPTEAP